LPLRVKPATIYSCMERGQAQDRGTGLSLRDNPDFKHLKGVLATLQQDCCLPSVQQRLCPGKSLQWKRLLHASLQASLQEVLFTSDSYLQQQALQRLRLWLSTRIFLTIPPQVKDPSPSPSHRVWRLQVEALLHKSESPQTLTSRSSTKLRPVLPPLSHITPLNRRSFENALTADTYQPLRRYLHQRLAENTERTRTRRLERSGLRSRVGRKPSPGYFFS